MVPRPGRDCEVAEVATAGAASEFGVGGCETAGRGALKAVRGVKAGGSRRRVSSRASAVWMASSISLACWWREAIQSYNSLVNLLRSGSVWKMAAYISSR